MTTYVHDTTIGRLTLALDGAGTALAAVRIDPAAEGPAPEGLAAEAAGQVDAYLAGERTAFDLPLAPRGTAFERAVWDALAEVPYGETTTYGALARQLGRPSAARAVGRANGANPICVVLPCHRVVGADGSLTGYAYGLDVKRRLLALESEAVVGVRTTGIYCRPSCTPPRRPLARNTRRYASPAAARAAGLRACKLCHPG